MRVAQKGDAAEQRVSVELGINIELSDQSLRIFEALWFIVA
jgi:hypothetical protein